MHTYIAVTTLDINHRLLFRIQLFGDWILSLSSYPYGDGYKKFIFWYIKIYSPLKSVDVPEEHVTPKMTVDFQRTK
jgi:hypothetical protein